MSEELKELDLKEINSETEEVIKEITVDTQEPLKEDLLNTKKVRTKMAQVSIAEFMYKNIHLLGFENTSRALNVAFRECIDNSLDACNTHNIAPQIDIVLKKLDKKTYKLTFKDNGPGVDPLEAPNICCRLLYGDKFTQHEILRGQQGLGLTSLVLYAQKTSNKPAVITVKRKEDPLAHVYHLMIDIKKNKPIVLKHKKVNLENFESGFIVELDIVATYVKKGNHSPETLLEQYLYLNPNLSLKFTDEEGIVINRPRITEEQPPKLKAVKHVPFYQEIGDFNYILKKEPTESLGSSLLSNFELDNQDLQDLLQRTKFCKHQIVSSLTENQILELKENASIITQFKKPLAEETIHVDHNLTRVITKNNTIHYDEVIQTASTPMYFKHGVSRVLVYGFYGGETLAEDSKVELLRVGNNSPLRYHSSSCLITKTVSSYNWKRVGFMQTENEMPRGKLILIVHVCATKLPYLSESKDSIAEDTTIKNQIIECLDKLSRQIKRYLAKLQLHKVKEEKCHVITKILPDLKKSLHEGLSIHDCSLNTEKDLESQEDLILLTRIMEAPCIYVHKDSNNMVCINPTPKTFKLNMVDKKTLENVLEINLNHDETKVYSASYEPKTHLFKGVSHVSYHIFKHPAVLTYSNNITTESNEK